MKTTVEFLDACKAKLGIARDTDLARALQISKAQISYLRSGTNCFSDETAKRVADVLGIEAPYVIACAYSERARDPEIKGVWVKIAEAFATIALVAGVGVGAPATSDARTLHNDQTINYTNYKRSLG